MFYTNAIAQIDVSLRSTCTSDHTTARNRQIIERIKSFGSRVYRLRGGDRRQLEQREFNRLRVEERGSAWRRFNVAKGTYMACRAVATERAPGNALLGQGEGNRAVSAAVQWVEGNVALLLC